MTAFVNLSDINGQNTDLGSGFDAMVMQDPRGAYDLDVNPSGVGAVSVTHAENGTSASVAGAEYLIFNNGSQAIEDVFDDLLVVLPPEEAQVARVYNTAFGRKPDLAGLEYWIEQKNAGMDIFEIAARFMDSDEFTSAYGDVGSLNNAEVVNALYINVLGRAPDTAGFNFWKGELDSGARSRTDVFVDMTESPENKENVAPWLIDEGVDSLNQGISNQDLIDAGLNEGELDMSALDINDLEQYNALLEGSVEMEKSSDQSVESGLEPYLVFLSGDDPVTLTLTDALSGGYVGLESRGHTVIASSQDDRIALTSRLSDESGPADVINIDLSAGGSNTVVFHTIAWPNAVIEGFTADGTDVFEMRLLNPNTANLYQVASADAPATTGQVIEITDYAGDGSLDSVANAMNSAVDTNAIDYGFMALLQVGNDAQLYGFLDYDKDGGSDYRYGNNDVNGNGQVDADEVRLLLSLKDTPMSALDASDFGL